MMAPANHTDAIMAYLSPPFKQKPTICSENNGTMTLTTQFHAGVRRGGAASPATRAAVARDVDREVEVNDRSASVCRSADEADAAFVR
jgi:hypothetical protein